MASSASSAASEASASYNNDASRKELRPKLIASQQFPNAMTPLRVINSLRWCPYNNQLAVILPETVHIIKDVLSPLSSGAGFGGIADAARTSAAFVRDDATRFVHTRRGAILAADLLKDEDGKIGQPFDNIGRGIGVGVRFHEEHTLSHVLGMMNKERNLQHEYMASRTYLINVRFVEWTPKVLSVNGTLQGGLGICLSDHTHCVFAEQPDASWSLVQDLVDPIVFEPLDYSYRYCEDARYSKKRRIITFGPNGEQIVQAAPVTSEPAAQSSSYPAAAAEEEEEAPAKGKKASKKRKRKDEAEEATQPEGDGASAAATPVTKEKQARPKNPSKQETLVLRKLIYAHFYRSVIETFPHMITEEKDAAEEKKGWKRFSDKEEACVQKCIKEALEKYKDEVKAKKVNKDELSKEMRTKLRADIRSHKKPTTDEEVMMNTKQPGAAPSKPRKSAAAATEDGESATAAEPAAPTEDDIARNAIYTKLHNVIDHVSRIDQLATTCASWSDLIAEQHCAYLAVGNRAGRVLVLKADASSQDSTQPKYVGFFVVSTQNSQLSAVRFLPWKSSNGDLLLFVACVNGFAAIWQIPSSLDENNKDVISEAKQVLVLQEPSVLLGQVRCVDALQLGERAVVVFANGLSTTVCYFDISNNSIALSWKKSMQIHSNMVSGLAIQGYDATTGQLLILSSSLDGSLTATRINLSSQAHGTVDILQRDTAHAIYGIALSPNRTYLAIERETQPVLKQEIFGGAAVHLLPVAQMLNESNVVSRLLATTSSSQYPLQDVKQFIDDYFSGEMLLDLARQCVAAHAQKQDARPLRLMLLALAHRLDKLLESGQTELVGQLRQLQETAQFSIKTSLAQAVVQRLAMIEELDAQQTKSLLCACDYISSSLNSPQMKNSLGQQFESIVELLKKAYEKHDPESAPKLVESIDKQEAFPIKPRESCIFCSEPIAISNQSTCTCIKGHGNLVSPVSFLVLRDPSAKLCPSCDTLLEANAPEEECPYCGINLIMSSSI